MENLDEFLNIEKSHLQEIEPTLMAISGTSMVMMAYRMYKEYMNKAARKCDTMVGRDKTLCMTKYKIEGLEKQYDKLKSSLTKCGQAKYPNKCRQKINQKMLKVQEKLDKNKKRFDMIYKLAQQSKRQENQ